MEEPISNIGLINVVDDAHDLVKKTYNQDKRAR